MSATPFADRLFDAIEGVGSAACVGLDPDLARPPGELGEQSPAEAIEVFSTGVLVSAGRSVIYPERAEGENWQGATGRAASEFSSALRSLG